VKQGERVEQVREGLLRWYAVHGRDLPWRRTRDPYAIWVSEVMLQQTRVETVVPYYERWMRRLPTVEALARARMGTVLKLWEGLGYYARARNLQRGAKAVVAEWGGKLPSTAGELSRLPGVGRYTAGAIASIAFGRTEPVLDGNVRRVLCRLFRIRTNPREPKTARRLWRLAAALVKPGDAGRVNEALMDLGATVCVPREPRCEVCPVASACEVRGRLEQAMIPVRKRKPPIPHYEIAAGVVWKAGRILIDRRQAEGLLGGLWEFPGGKRLPGETAEACVVREVEEELGVRVDVVRPLATVRHAYTHFRITLEAFECRWKSGRPRALGCAAWKWVRPEELDRYAFPTANRRVIEALRNARSPARSRRRDRVS
jgi:A/G-specific adenine glycosylase